MSNPKYDKIIRITYPDWIPDWALSNPKESIILASSNETLIKIEGPGINCTYELKEIKEIKIEDA